MRVALISLDQKWEDKLENMQRVRLRLEELMSKQVDWVIFPEMTLTGFTMHASDFSEDKNQSPTIDFFVQCALKYRIYICFGMIISSSSHPLNSLVVISPEGNILADYAKIHPFSFARENIYFDSGNEIKTVLMNDIEVGVSICYDLRFPEIFRAMPDSCQIMVNIANWPQKRVHHWRILSQARAIENQVYFIGVNRTGTDPEGFFYEKSSLIAAPDGTLLESESVGDFINIYDLDLLQVDRQRTRFPVKNDRKKALYKTFF